jgi:phosphoribosylaminoimidazole-succinocarboxamide synthase
MSKTNAIVRTDFSFPGQLDVYNGKVRDVYFLEGDMLVMVTTDRISAFDTVFPRGIPYKGQVLNQIAAKFLQQTADIIPNWMIDTPDSMVTAGWRCEPYKIEMVIRGYLSGHAWREYKAGKRTLCGVPMPDGMIENDKFPTPIITPTTKAKGHDEDISKVEIIQLGLATEQEYADLEKYTYRLFERGTEIAAKKGLILVDTKYEFGTFNRGIMLLDEIHTPDSSRYFYKKGYAERQAKKLPQKQLSKEFFREWLMSKGYQGLEGQTMPEVTDDVIREISARYIELYEQITGEKFVPVLYISNETTLARIEQNVNTFLKKVA